MNKLGVLGGTLEAIGEEAKQDVRVAASQITGKQGKQNTGQKQQQKNPQQQQGQGLGHSVVQQLTGQGTSEQGSIPPSATNQQPSGDQKEFIKDLYGDAPAISDQAVAQKEAEDKQKQEALKQRLHNEYYQKLTNPQKQQEERPAEKVKREKDEERWKLQENEKKKPPPLAVKRAQQSAEKFRGASG